MIEKIIKAFKELEEVEAMMLGGSRATGVYDEKSDYDVYVYLNSPLEEIKRREILEGYCSYMEYSNQFWELEDDGVMNNGIELELIYRDYNFFEETISNMIERNVGNGYSTCFYDNLLHSKILFDKGGKIKQTIKDNKNLISSDYVQAIVDINYPLIYKSMPALSRQIKKAMKRKDYNSVVHRVAEYFAIYYDLLFAINETSHPGEKRLVELASALAYVPEQFAEKVNGIFFNMIEDHETAIKYLDILSKDIEELIVSRGYKI